MKTWRITTFEVPISDKDGEPLGKFVFSRETDEAEQEMLKRLRGEFDKLIENGEPFKTPLIKDETETALTLTIPETNSTHYKVYRPKPGDKWKKGI